MEAPGPPSPGLRVEAAAVVRRVRRLPLPGRVLVSPGDRVGAGDLVARSELPGEPHTIDLSRLLGVPPADVPRALRVRTGQSVAAGQVLAAAAGLFGLGRREACAPVAGSVDLISELTGQITLRTAPTPVEVRAHVAGRIGRLLPGEGAVVETVGALVQGVFGIGGEARGRLHRVAGGPADVLDGVEPGRAAAGAVLLAGALATRRGLRSAAAAGAAGVVVGGVSDADLSDFLGHDLGAPEAGRSPVPFPVILTEGFGRLAMAERTFGLLASLEGSEASIDGTTQIRAGVRRPEVIVPDLAALEALGALRGRPSGARSPRRPPDAGPPPSEPDDPPGFGAASAGPGLRAGVLVRLIRDPHFGAVARVVDLPVEPQPVETEARVRVLRARLLAGGGEVVIPRANVEVIGG